MLMAIFSFAAVSCDNRNDDVNYQDTYSVVLDIKNVSFANTADGYSIKRSFTKPMVSSDVVLIYRKANPNAGANEPTIWQLIPRTLFLDEGELDYDFDFSRVDFTIYAGGTYNIATTPQFIQNQTFRIVIIPGYFSKNANLDITDYNSVIREFNIDDSNVTILNK